MSSFVVTGAAGFIGSALASRLLSQGHRVLAIDNLSTGSLSNVPVGAQFIEANCQDALLYERLPKDKFEAIYHIAGQSSGEISFDNPVYDLQTNAQATLQLIQYGIKNGCHRFYYASTMSVYGEQPDAPVSESATLRPQSFYGVGKLASEHYLRIYSHQFGINTAALRLFNVYGPGQNMENLRQGMVSIYLAQALARGEIHVRGSKDRFRDFVYIDDVVDAFLMLQPTSKPGYAVYNIGTGLKTHVRDLVEMICAAMPEKSITVRYEGSTPGDMFGIVAASAAAFQDYGWKARVELRDGLGKMIHWATNQSKEGHDEINY